MDTKDFLGNEYKKLEHQKVDVDKALDKAYLTEAGKLTEGIVAFINKKAKDEGITPEQVVFAVALATINFRETAPNGKQWFDEWAYKAQEYYETNK